MFISINLPASFCYIFYERRIFLDHRCRYILCQSFNSHDLPWFSLVIIRYIYQYFCFFYTIHRPMAHFNCRRPYFNSFKNKGFLIDHHNAACGRLSRRLSQFITIHIIINGYIDEQPSAKQLCFRLRF